MEGRGKEGERGEGSGGMEGKGKEEREGEGVKGAIQFLASGHHKLSYATDTYDHKSIKKSFFANFIILSFQDIIIFSFPFYVLLRVLFAYKHKQLNKCKHFFMTDKQYHYYIWLNWLSCCAVSLFDSLGLGQSPD